MYNKFRANDCYYEVVKEKDKFFAIYFLRWGERRFLTHRESLRSAQKLAKLLADAYEIGYNSGKDLMDWP